MNRQNDNKRKNLSLSTQYRLTFKVTVVITVLLRFTYRSCFFNYKRKSQTQLFKHLLAAVAESTPTFFLHILTGTSCSKREKDKLFLV